MEEKIKHLLNLNTQRFICMMGLQGSGKSTIVNQFEKVGYFVVCPDRIRYEIAKSLPGNEDKEESELQGVLQSNDNLVWSNASKLVRQYLKEGKSVIFDATMTTVKARKYITRLSKECNVPVTAIYLECPLNIAQTRNLERSTSIIKHKNGQPIYGRYVPSSIIELKWISQVLPTIKEGFNEVYIIHVGLEKKNIDNFYSILNDIKTSNNLLLRLQEMYDNGSLENMFPSLYDCWNVDQENKHHNLLLHEHIINTASLLKDESLALFTAGLLHDVGKVKTKKKYGKLLVNTERFKKNDKLEIKKTDKEIFLIARKLTHEGEFTELLTKAFFDLDVNAHYYEHEKVGAIIARRELLELGANEDFVNDVYEYIINHMIIPHRIISVNEGQKIIDKLGEKVLDIVKFNLADKLSSNSPPEETKQISSENLIIINELIKNEV